jgi:resuscitation-promoting factor RpfB
VPDRLIARLLQAVVVTALVGGTTAFVAFDKTVTVSVDGRASEVRSFGRTVGDVLAHEGIQVGPHDLVVPTSDERLESGDRIMVRFARPVNLTVDGESRRVWTTARSVDEALMMFGVRTEGAAVSASRSARISRGGIDLDVRLPHDLTLLADGKRFELTTNAATVREALAEGGITLRPQDRLNAEPTDVPADEQVLAVTRVDGRLVAQEIAIPFKTTRRTSADLFKGETRVLKKGKVGARVLTWERTFLDGKLYTRRRLSDRVVVKPVTQVVLVGTKARPQNSPEADGLNWAALARCESGGNPNAYNPAGPYYGLYQFLASTWHSVGGTGVPTDHGAAEQTYRAQLLYKRSGAGQWPVCGRYL